MAKKNNAMIQIHRQKEMLEHYCRELVPNLYAAFGITLYDMGFDADQIEEIVMNTQKLWEENIGYEGDMIKRCEELTGIEFRRGTN